MYCVYHAIDLDGWCSAAIVREARRAKGANVKMVPWNYGDPLPTMSGGEGVVLVDISFPIADMIRMAEEHRTHSFIWIDHHKSAIEDYRARPSGCNGILAYLPRSDEKVSACELTWRYFMGEDSDIPDAVHLLSLYDSWNNSDKDLWETTVMPLQYALRQVVKGPETFPAALLNLTYDATRQTQDYVRKGRQLYEYQKGLDADACNNCFEGEVAGCNALFLNSAFNGSPQFRSVFNPKKHDLMVKFGYVGSKHKFAVSFYSENSIVDCSEIAKMFGGGGHKGAAGCMLSWNEMGKLLGEL